METFPGEEELKDEKKRTLLNPIFNHAKGVRGQDGRDNGIGRYSSTKKLSIIYMESIENGKYGKVRAVMDVWIGWIEACLGLEKYGAEKIRIPKTGGRYLLTERHFPLQVGHNDFEHGKTKNPGYFFLLTADKATTIWVCHGSHRFVEYPENDKTHLVKGLK